MKHRKRIEAHVKGFEQMPKRTQKAIVEMIKAAHRYVGKKCQAASDGECQWKHCPQIRDGEPEKSGRHCPIDTWETDPETQTA